MHKGIVSTKAVQLSGALITLFRGVNEKNILKNTALH